MKKSLKKLVYKNFNEGLSLNQTLKENKDENKDTVTRYYYSARKRSEEALRFEGWNPENFSQFFNEIEREFKDLANTYNSEHHELVHLCYFLYHLEQYLGDKWSEIELGTKNNVLKIDPEFLLPSEIEEY